MRIIIFILLVFPVFSFAQNGLFRTVIVKDSIKIGGRWIKQISENGSIVPGYGLLEDASLVYVDTLSPNGLVSKYQLSQFNGGILTPDTFVNNVNFNIGSKLLTLGRSGAPPLTTSFAGIARNSDINDSLLSRDGNILMRQLLSDTNTYDATRHWVKGQIRDSLLTAKNLYNSDGVLNNDRLFDLSGNKFTKKSYYNDGPGDFEYSQVDEGDNAFGNPTMPSSTVIPYHYNKFKVFSGDSAYSGFGYDTDNGQYTFFRSFKNNGIVSEELYNKGQIRLQIDNYTLGSQFGESKEAIRYFSAVSTNSQYSNYLLDINGFAFANSEKVALSSNNNESKLSSQFYKNNLAQDSILTTDKDGIFQLKHKSFFGVGGVAGNGIYGGSGRLTNPTTIVNQAGNGLIFDSAALYRVKHDRTSSTGKHYGYVNEFANGGMDFETYDSTVSQSIINKVDDGIKFEAIDLTISDPVNKAFTKITPDKISDTINASYSSGSRLYSSSSRTKSNINFSTFSDSDNGYQIDITTGDGVKIGAINEQSTVVDVGGGDVKFFQNYNSAFQENVFTVGYEGAIPRLVTQSKRISISGADDGTLVYQNSPTKGLYQYQGGIWKEFTTEGNTFNGANNLLKLNAGGYIPTFNMPGLTGDVTSADGSTTTTLPNINSNVGTFNNLTVNAKGQVTAASNVAYLTSFTESDPLSLKLSNNLSDINNAATARNNLGLLAIAASGSASDLIGGTIPSARFGASTIPTNAISATGTASASTYLRGDGSWSSVVGGGGLPDVAANGFVVRNGAGSTINRAIASGNGISITDGDGVAANPTVSMAINPLTSTALNTNDELAFGDVSNANSIAKVTISELLKVYNREHLRKYAYVYNNEFINAVSTTTGGNDLVSTVSGAGAASNVNPTNANNIVGVNTLATGTTATGRTVISTSGSSIRLGGGEWVYEASIYIPTLSNATERYQLIIGFFDTYTAANQVDGVYMLYDEGGVSTGSSASANWQAVTANNSTRTFTTSTSAVNAASWNRIKVIVNPSASSVEFFINDISQGVTTTNIPNTAGRELGFGLGIIKSLGTTSRTVLVDYMNVNNYYTTPK
jgi:hypothetical protein